jgi:hypothetical protein
MEGRHSLHVALLLSGVRDLNIEGNRNNIEDILFQRFSVPGQHIEQIEFFGEQMMVLHMIHKLLLPLFEDLLAVGVLRRLPKC